MADNLDVSGVNRSLQEFTYDVDKARRELAELGKGFASVKNNLQSSFSGLAATGSAADRALSTTTRSMVALGEKIPGLGLAIGALGGAFEFLAQQTDEAIISFRKLAEVGVSSAGGLETLKQNVITSGLSLQGYTQIVGSNASALARFKGSVAAGADEFAKISGFVKDTDAAGDQLRLLGYNAETMGDATSAFVARQTSLGLAQGKTYQQLAQGARDYMFEMDALSRVTGLSRKQLESQQEAARNEARFRATLDQLNEKGLGTQAKALEDFSSRLSIIKDPNFAAGFRDLTAGMGATSEAARMLQLTTAGAAEGIALRLKQGQITGAEAEKELQEAVQRNLGALRANALAVGDSSKVYNAYAAASEFATKGIKSAAEIEKERNDTIANNKDTSKKLNEDMILLQKSSEKLNQQMSIFAFEGMPAMLTVTRRLQLAFENLLFVLAKTTGTAPPSGARAPTQSPQLDRIIDQVKDSLGLGGGGAGGGQQGGGQQQGGGASSLEYNDPRLAELIKGRPNTNAGAVSEKLYTAAKSLFDQNIAGLQFTGFNDGYTRDSPLHSRGLAVDFTVPNGKDRAEEFRKLTQQLGFSGFRDEYNNPSPRASGPHFHAEVSARNGFNGMLSGPSSGYRPNVIMHGDEQLRIKPMSEVGKISSITADRDEIMSKQLDRLDELVSTMKASVGIQQKILHANY